MNSIDNIVNLNCIVHRGQNEIETGWNKKIHESARYWSTKVSLTGQNNLQTNKYNFN